MAAGGFAADEEEGGGEFGLRVGDEPFGGVEAVVGTGGEGVFGGEAVADGDDEEGGHVGEGFEEGVLVFFGLEDPTEKE